MLKILQTFNDGWIVRDSAYTGEWRADHEETVPRDFPGMRVPEFTPMDLVDQFNSLFDGNKPSGIMGRYDCWGEIGVILRSLDIMLTSTLVPACSVDQAAVTAGPFAVSTTPKVQRRLQRFALNLLTGRIGLEEDEKHRFTFFWLDEVRDKSRETCRLDEWTNGQVPREHFEALGLALREMGRVRSFDTTLIKITHPNGGVSWGRIENSLMVSVEEPDEMTIPGTELIAPNDAQDRVDALQKIWVGVGDDETMAFKARAAMAWAISTLPPKGKILTWFDEGGTGKTSFINGFNACFPSKSASVNWEQINKGGFDAGVEFSHMIGKTVSFSDETCQLGKKETALATMKALSTGDTETARHGNGKTTEVYLKLWQVLFSNVGSVFPKGYAFERRLIHMPKVSEPAARLIPEEMHGTEKLGKWLFSEEEVGKTFMALAIAGQGIWEKEFHCEWPEVLQKWDGEEDETQLDEQFCLPPKDSDIYPVCSSVAGTLKSKSKLFVEGLRKLARVWNAADGGFYGDHDADSSVTGRIPKTFMLLDEKTPSFNASLTACHDPATVSGFIPDAPDGTVKNFSNMLKEFGVEFITISKKPAFYPGGKPTMRAPHADESDRWWKAVRIVLGVQAYGSAVYEAPEVPVENGKDVTPITPANETQSTPIPPVPSPIKLGSREAQRAIHETYQVEGDLIAVNPEDKKPKGKWSLKSREDGLATKLTKTWPEGEEACAFIPTGHTVLLDLDCHEAGPSGWEVLNREVGSYGSEAFPRTLGELTPSGGIHLLYRVEDLTFVERLKAVSHVDGIEVDVKVGGKGQAVCAGSKTTKGGYKICSLPEGESIAEMSEAMKSWLARKGYVGEDPAVIERRRKEEEARRAAVRAEREARRLQGEEPHKPKFLNEMEAEFDKAIDDVATASSGGRNSALNETAFKLFSKSKKFFADFQDEDWLDDETIKERLVSAGLESGLERSEVTATIESAWVGVFGGTTTVVAPAVASVIEPVVTPEEDVEVQEVVNEDLKKASSKGESLFQATGYQVDWKGNFHKVDQAELEAIHEDDVCGEPVNSTDTSQETETTPEELEAIHEDDEWGNGLFSPDEYDGWCKLVDKLSLSQEELTDLHENDDPYTNGSLFGDDGLDGWGNEDYVANYEIIPFDEGTGEDDGWGNPVDETSSLHPTKGARFEELFDDDESDGWVNPEYDVYEVNYPIIPLDEEIGIDDLGF